MKTIKLALMGLMLFGCEKPEDSDAFHKLKSESLKTVARQQSEIKRLNRELTAARDQSQKMQSDVAFWKDQAETEKRLHQQTMDAYRSSTIKTVEAQLRQINGK